MCSSNPWESNHKDGPTGHKNKLNFQSLKTSFSPTYVPNCVCFLHKIPENKRLILNLYKIEEPFSRYYHIYMYILVYLSIDSLIQFTEKRQDNFRMATAVAINNYCRETPDKCVTTNDDSSSLRKRYNQQNLLKRYINNY